MKLPESCVSQYNSVQMTERGYRVFMYINPDAGVCGLKTNTDVGYDFQLPQSLHTPLTGASAVYPNSAGVQKSEVIARHMKINPPHYKCHTFLPVAGPQARHPG